MTFIRKVLLLGPVWSCLPVRVLVRGGLCLPTAVVSLNDSEDLSSANSEEESGAEEEESGAEEEDSGSEVEIIEEVKGNGRRRPPAPALYLEELPPHDQFLREQATAVLSLVAPEDQVSFSQVLSEHPTNADPLKRYFRVD